MNILEKLRAEKNMTIRDLAEEAKLNPTTVVRIEKGRTLANSVTVAKLAKALKVPIDDLIELTGEKFRAKKDRVIIDVVKKDGKPLALEAQGLDMTPEEIEATQELFVRIRNFKDMSLLKKFLEDNGVEVYPGPLNE